jgi:outer membrane biosynthesis protein TonB
MSPEQCRGAGGVDQRSDVYSLGCVLFALLAGRPPFQAEGAGELIVLHLREQPPQVGAFRPGIPPEVEHLIARCLAKDPAHRYTDGNDLAHAIGALGFSSAATAPTRFATDSRPAVPTPTTLSSASGVVSGAPRRSRALPIALGGIIVGGAAAAIVVVVTRDTGSSQPSAPPIAQAPATAPPIKAPAEAPKPEPPKPPPAPKPEELVAGRMKAVLDGFVAWAKDHAGAACPDVAALGVDPNDPWHHAMKLSCTDQPGDQMVGLLSAGPDGQFGSADDIASWSLAHDVTVAVHGKRWVAATKPAKPARPTVVAKPKQPPAPPPTPAAPAKKPPPVELDENGIPISR